MEMWVSEWQKHMDLAFGQARSRGQNWPEEQEGQSICHSDQNSTPECSEKGGGSSYGSGVVVTGFGRGRDRPRVWTHYCWTGHYSTGMSAHLVYKSYLLNLYPFTSPPGWLSSHPLEGIVELPPLSSDNWDGGKRSWACSPCPVMLLLLKLELVTQTAT